jgi:CheY-like chemotaxis protein
MKPIHILLVEDNAGDILLTTETLSEGKIANTISVVKDGWEAIQYLEKKDNYIGVQSPDLIILDINLPKLNGHEVVKYIKTNSKLKTIPVIMLTTSASPNDSSKSLENRADCFITKPVDAKDFLKVIASIENFWISIIHKPTEPKN